MAGGAARGRRTIAVDAVASPHAVSLPVGPEPRTRHNGQKVALPDDTVRARVQRPDMNGRATARKTELNGSAVAFAEAYLRRSADLMRAISPADLADVIEILATARAGRQQVFVCGNGGSASTASHFAAGLSKEGSWERPQKFRALTLTDNIAWLTSLANDTDYTRVFVEQLKNHADPNDVLIAFSGSGNSRNVLLAVEWANAHGLVTVGISGRSGGELATLAHHRVSVDSDHMGHVEEGHFLIQHLITYYFMEAQRDGGER